MSLDKELEEQLEQKYFMVKNRKWFSFLGGAIAILGISLSSVWATAKTAISTGTAQISTNEIIRLRDSATEAHEAILEKIIGWQLIYEHDHKGNAINNTDLQELIEAINLGADVKIIMELGQTKTINSFVCDWVLVNEVHEKDYVVSCMNTSHVSITRNGETQETIFKEDAYHWFIVANSTSLLDMSRWGVNDKNVRNNSQHNNQNVAMKWFVRNY